MSMLLPGILMYLPIGIGLILVYKFYNDKINKSVFKRHFKLLLSPDVY